MSNHSSLQAPGSSLPPELYGLMSAWADAALTDDEFAQLDTLLKESTYGRQAFARYVRMCQSLPELIVPSFDAAIRECAANRERSFLHVAESDESRPESISPRPGHEQRSGAGRGESRDSWKPRTSFDAAGPSGLAGTLHSRHLLRRLARQPWVVVAGLLVAVLIGVSGVFPRGNPRAVNPVAILPVAPAIDAMAGSGDLDSHLAVVTRSANVVWESGSVPAEIGAALKSQVLKLASGTLEFEFECGASLRLRGPAEFAVISKSRGKLLFGELSAQVPENAHGFTIDTPSVEVVDLGTEFGVSVDRAGIADVHVFRGLVETRRPSGDEQPGLLERLETDQTRRFAPDQRTSEMLKFDESKYPAPPEHYHDEPTTRGAICLLREPPKSLAVGALESNEFILLFEERRDVQLPRPIPVSLSLPGRYDRFRGKDGKLRPPLHVDSYLLHFDALTTPRNYTHLRLDGSVTFPRPILGVIAVGPALSVTDGLFGYADVIQSDARSRGLDRKAKGDNLDVVTLSEDRRTLHVSFSVGGSCDQLRILIQAEQNQSVEEQ